MIKVLINRNFLNSFNLLCGAVNPFLLTQWKKLCIRYVRKHKLLPETDVEQAYYAAERIRDMITKLIFEGFSVSASFGVAQYKNGENIDYLIKRADDKMYMAKAGGRNRVKYL